MGELTDLWVGVQNWLFETFVGPVIFWLGQMAWYEPAYNAVEFVMLGVVQIAVIALGMRFFERRWPLEKAGDDRLIGVDRVYTVAEQARHHPVRHLRHHLSDLPGDRAADAQLGHGAAAAGAAAAVAGRQRAGLVPGLLRALRLRGLLAAPRPARRPLVVGAAQPASQPAPHDGVVGRPQPRARRFPDHPRPGRCSRRWSACSPASTSRS